MKNTNKQANLKTLFACPAPANTSGGVVTWIFNNVSPPTTQTGFEVVVACVQCGVVRDREELAYIINWLEKQKWLTPEISKSLIANSQYIWSIWEALAKLTFQLNRDDILKYILAIVQAGQTTESVQHVLHQLLSTKPPIFTDANIQKVCESKRIGLLARADIAALISAHQQVAKNDPKAIAQRDFDLVIQHTKHAEGVADALRYTYILQHHDYISADNSAAFEKYILEHPQKAKQIAYLLHQFLFIKHIPKAQLKDYYVKLLQHIQHSQPMAKFLRCVTLLSSSANSVFCPEPTQATLEDMFAQLLHEAEVLSHILDRLVEVSGETLNKPEWRRDNGPACYYLFVKMNEYASEETMQLAAKVFVILANANIPLTPYREQILDYIRSQRDLHSLEKLKDIMLMLGSKDAPVLTEANFKKLLDVSPEKLPTLSAFREKLGSLTPKIKPSQRGELRDGMQVMLGYFFEEHAKTRVKETKAMSSSSAATPPEDKAVALVSEADEAEKAGVLNLMVPPPASKKPPEHKGAPVSVSASPEASLSPPSASGGKKEGKIIPEHVRAQPGPDYQPPLTIPIPPVSEWTTAASRSGSPTITTPSSGPVAAPPAPSDTSFSSFEPPKKSSPQFQ